MKLFHKIFLLTVSFISVYLIFSPSVVFASDETKMCVPPPSHMVSWWTGDGTFADLLGRNNGTQVGGMTFGSGEVGLAFLGNGTDSAVQISDSPSLHVSSGNFTVDAWVSFNSFSEPGNGDMSLVNKMANFPANANNDGWRLLKQTDNHFWFCFGGGINNGCSGGLPTTVISTTSVSDSPLGTWFHVAAVKNDMEIALYINGIKEASKPVPAFTDTNISDLFIGSENNGRSQLNGLIDEVELFNKALSPEKIQAIFKAGSAGTCKTDSGDNNGQDTSGNENNNG